MHLVVAPLVRASIVVVSTYYMHHKTPAQLLVFMHMVEREADGGNGDPNVKSPTTYLKKLFVSSGIYTALNLYTPNFEP